MKLRNLILTAIVLLFACSITMAQVIITKSDSIPLDNDSIVKFVLPEVRGNIQWQKSIDTKNWVNLENEINDSLLVKTNIEAIYRAVITDGTCIPAISDSVVVVTIDTISKYFIIPQSDGLDLISDSTDLSDGIYIYKETKESEKLEIGKVIIDEDSGGTIRRITEVVQNGDTVVTHTEQATMEDLFFGTTFKLSTAMVQPTKNLKSASLVEIEKALTDDNGFIHPIEIKYQSADGNTLKSVTIFDEETENNEGGTLYMHKDWSGLKFYDESGSFYLPNKQGVIVKYSGNAKSYIQEGYFTFDPEFKFEFEFDRPKLNWENLKIQKGEITKFKFYSDNSLIEFKNVLAFENNISIEFGKEWTLVPNIINAKFKFIVGGVPVWIDFKIDVKSSLTLELGGNTIITRGFKNTNYITVGAGYENDVWYPLKEISKEHQVYNSRSTFLSSNIKFDIYPSVNIKLYSIVGPYLKVGPYLDYEANVSESANWDQSMDLGIDANVGASVDVFGMKIASYNFNYNLYSSNIWKAPSGLELISGGDQIAAPGVVLPQPVRIKATDSENNALSDVHVIFQPEKGTVNNSTVVTDEEGIAETSWTLSSNQEEHKLTIKVLDGKNQEIPGCLLTVKANAISNSPVLTTSSVTNITQTTATSGGNITSDGGATITARGVCWNTSGSPTTANSKTTNGTGTGSFTANLTGLTANTTYYVRAYASNSKGTAYGNEVSFTTGQNITSPVLTTSAISNITHTSAVGGGNITSDGGSTVTSRGVCWSTSQNPTTSNSKTSNGTGTGSFTSNLTELIANTTYYVRAYATNSKGTIYGNQVSFTTSSSTTNTVTDVDGNVYHTVTIGTQVWMVENLKTTKYNDGTPIPLVTDANVWSSLDSPAYCWYDNNSSYKNPYGALYNWYAVNTGKLCPEGWHVPSAEEWNILTTYLCGKDIYHDESAGMLKESGTSHWFSPNLGATNESGFTALPGSFRNEDGTFGSSIGSYGIWWTASEFNTGTGSDAEARSMYFNGINVTANGGNMRFGSSVRCIKD